jgi:hypothetical protein
MGRTKQAGSPQQPIQDGWQVFVEANDAEAGTLTHLVLLQPPTANVRALRGDGAPSPSVALTSDLSVTCLCMQADMWWLPIQMTSHRSTGSCSLGRQPCAAACTSQSASSRRRSASCSSTPTISKVRTPRGCVIYHIARGCLIHHAQDAPTLHKRASSYHADWQAHFSGMGVWCLRIWWRPSPKTR